MNLRAKLAVKQGACETGLALDRAGVSPTSVTVRSTLAAVSTLVLSLQLQPRTVLFENLNLIVFAVCSSSSTIISNVSATTALQSLQYQKSLCNLSLLTLSKAIGL